MIGILLATKIEARPLVKRLGARKQRGAAMPAWTFGGEASPAGVVVVCGMGKAAAARGAEMLIAEWGATTVINVGICGALGEDESASPAVGELLRISASADGDAVLAGQPCQAIECAAGAWGHLPVARLASVSEPVFEDARRRVLAGAAEVVDMEGYAVAEVCNRRGVEAVLLKGVSDRADRSGKRDIVRNILRVSRRLARAVVRSVGIPPLPDPDGPASPVKGEGFQSGRSVTLPKLMRFAKIEHSAFSLPLLLAGAKLGAEARTGDPSAWPGLVPLGLIALAGVGARTMGMAMNRVFDRRLDALNPRTAGRELPSGKMGLAAALAVAVAGLALYLVACALLGPLCLLLSPVPAVPLITYSLLKRFTNLCHFGIGLCMALAPLGAFVAVGGSLDVTGPAWLLAAFTFCWMSGSDVIYALQDIRSDRETGVRSLPASLGVRGASVVAACCHVAAAGAVAMLWKTAGAGWLSGVTMGVSIAALATANIPALPAAKRFFPISAAASVAGAVVVLV